jgi:phage-related protein
MHANPRNHLKTLDNPTPCKQGAAIQKLIGIQVLEYRVQLGGTPTDFKPIASVGSGAYEIRVRDVAGTFRTVYVTKFSDSIYVLHAFQKKTQKTA